MSEVWGSGRECQAVKAQEPPRGATPLPRSGAMAKRSHLAPEARGGDPESHPKPEARGSSWEERPMPEARASTWEEHPMEWWMHRQRRA